MNENQNGKYRMFVETMNEKVTITFWNLKTNYPIYENQFLLITIFDL